MDLNAILAFLLHSVRELKRILICWDRLALLVNHGDRLREKLLVSIADSSEFYSVHDIFTWPNSFLSCGGDFLWQVINHLTLA